MFCSEEVGLTRDIIREDMNIELIHDYEMGHAPVAADSLSALVSEYAQKSQRPVGTYVKVDIWADVPRARRARAAGARLHARDEWFSARARRHQKARLVIGPKTDSHYDILTGRQFAVDVLADFCDRARKPADRMIHERMSRR